MWLNIPFRALNKLSNNNDNNSKHLSSTCYLPDNEVLYIFSSLGPKQSLFEADPIIIILILHIKELKTQRVS